MSHNNASLCHIGLCNNLFNGIKCKQFFKMAQPLLIQICNGAKHTF
jgi:hypothetical protein